MMKHSTPETDSTDPKETAALRGTTSDGSVAAAAGQDIDERLADVLARSAALPVLPVDEYGSLDERVDADIKLVVDRSAVRIRFPEPGEAPHDCDAVLDRGSRRGPRVQVTRANGRPVSVYCSDVLSMWPTAGSPAPVMLLARTSQDRYTVYFRTSVHCDGQMIRPPSAREVADRMLLAVADDVGRRLGRAEHWWQMSVALVAAQGDFGHEPAPDRFQWWIGHVAQEDFARLLERYRRPALGPHTLEQTRCDQARAPLVEPVPLCEVGPGPCPAHHGALRPAGHVATRSWARPRIKEQLSAAWWKLLRPLTRLVNWTEDWAYRLVTRPIDHAALRLRLPEPPPPVQPPSFETTAQHHGTAHARYRVLVDRELAGSAR